jgi:hypothetical protein
MRNPVEVYRDVLRALMANHKRRTNLHNHKTPECLRRIELWLANFEIIPGTVELTKDFPGGLSVTVRVLGSDKSGMSASWQGFDSSVGRVPVIRVAFEIEVIQDGIPLRFPCSAAVTDAINVELRYDHQGGVHPCVKQTSLDTGVVVPPQSSKLIMTMWALVENDKLKLSERSTFCAPLVPGTEIVLPGDMSHSLTEKLKLLSVNFNWEEFETWYISNIMGDRVFALID